MASNQFSKEERVMFAELCAGFEDQLVLSKRVSKYNTNGRMMEQAGDTIWRPMPYIMPVTDGLDQTANFDGVTQLSVPAQLTDIKNVAWTMSPTDLRDPQQVSRQIESAMRDLASAINVRMLRAASLQGSIFVKRTSAASGFDDAVQVSTAMTRVGIGSGQRTWAVGPADYGNMASNLASRQTVQGMPATAYTEGSVSRIAAVDILSMDYAHRLTVAGGSSVTINGANQYHVPKATQTAATGETSNVDNRYQLLTITVGSGTVAVGDAFTIAGVNEVHHITKEDTGQLKTFRIVDIVSGAGGSGVVKITPAIISNGGGSRAEQQYKNVSATPANGANITFLNTATGYVNPFFAYDALEILPGKLIVPEDSNLPTMVNTLTNGIPVLLSKDTRIENLGTRYRATTFFGISVKNPEMCGAVMFSQS